VTAAAETPDGLQPRLVGLVAGVQRHELPGVRVWAQRVMTDLPLLGDRMSRAWDEPHDPGSWVRLNAFAARLTAAVTDFLPLGLRTIAAALEPPGAAQRGAAQRGAVPGPTQPGRVQPESVQPGAAQRGAVPGPAQPGPTRPGPAQPGSVLAAVEWFRHAGAQLVEASVHGRTYAGRLGDPAARPEGGFSIARWTAWRARLDTLARGGDPAARAGIKLARAFDQQVAGHYSR
jgi:hypothetical protein